MGRVYAQLVALGALILGLSACEFPRESKPSVLVIAVDGLSFNSLNCDAEERGESSLEGLKTFCDESVGFTHAFTPSTMSQAALASVLTGLYPFDHGVRTNGSDFLSARFRTLAEVASASRYHTAFISGGPPIWRKSGLAQGFEIFDDTTEITAQQPYRPAAEVVRLALSWFDQQDDGGPFFTTLYLADLQFPQIATVSDAGDAREKSRAGQVAEVMESLNTLVKFLKSHKQWHRTHVVLLGLNSLDKSLSSKEPQPLSLKSSSTQVALFMKPASKEREVGLHWTIDRNVSLVDVSHTIFGWLGEAPPATSLPELQPKTLVSALVEPEPNWAEERLILSETAWPDWLEGAGVRWALRQKQFLYIHDRRPLIYNTLTDKLENMPLKAADPLWSSLSQDVNALLSKAKVPPFRGMSLFWTEQLQVAKELWIDGTTRPVKGNPPWTKWYLRRALQQRQWREVKRLSQDLGDPVGTYVASKHLNEFFPLPRNPCLRLILHTKGDPKAYQSECEDERVLALHAWRSAKADEDRAIAQDRYTRNSGHNILDQEIGRQNYLGELRWDVDREWPGGPNVADYLMSLKQFEPFVKKLPGLRETEDLRL